MNELGKFLKERRLELALSQKMLAEQIGITSITLWKIEKGKQIGSSTIRKLSKYLNIRTRDIRNLMLMKNENNE